MTKIEDKIIQLMSEGNRHFINLMFDHYSSALYGIVLRIVEDEALARKVIEEGFLKVWRSYSKFNIEKSNLFIWLFQIFRETAIDHLNNHKNTRNKNLSINELFDDKIIIPQSKSETPDTKEDIIVENRFYDSIDVFNKLWTTIKVTIRKFMFNVPKQINSRLQWASLHKRCVFNFNFILIILINLL